MNFYSKALGNRGNFKTSEPLSISGFLLVAEAHYEREIKSFGNVQNGMYYKVWKRQARHLSLHSSTHLRVFSAWGCALYSLQLLTINILHKSRLVNYISVLALKFFFLLVITVSSSGLEINWTVIATGSVS